MPRWHFCHYLNSERRALQVAIKPTGNVAGTATVTNAQDFTFQRSFPGQGADDDIVVASTRAYIAALNKLRAFLKSKGVLSSEDENGVGSESAEEGRRRERTGALEPLAAA
jgi:hypothetical protein